MCDLKDPGILAIQMTVTKMYITLIKNMDFRETIYYILPCFKECQVIRNLYYIGNILFRRCSSIVNQSSRPESED
jgi:hypothetical protein